MRRSRLPPFPPRARPHCSCLGESLTLRVCCWFHFWAFVGVNCGGLGARICAVGSVVWRCSGEGWASGQ